MEPQLADLFEGLTHFLHLSMRQEGDGVPVPLIVENVEIKLDRVVQGHQVVGESALAAERNVQLLSPLLQMHFGGHSVLTLNVDRGEAGQVGDEVAIAQLVHLLLDWNHFEWAEALCSLELLHVKGPQTSVVKVPRHDAERITHENLIYQK